MKKTFFTLAILTSNILFNTAYAGILLEKVSYAGFVMESHAINKTCTISDNKQLLKTYQLMAMRSKQRIELDLSVNAIKAKITEAKAGEIQAEIFPVDAPTVIYRAYQKTNGKIESVLLYEENGGSGQKNTNMAESAVALRNFIDLHCSN